MTSFFKHCSGFGGEGGREQCCPCVGWMWSQGRQADIWAPGGVSALLWASPLPYWERLRGFGLGVPPGPCGAPSCKDPGELSGESQGPTCLFSWGVFGCELTFTCLDLFGFWPKSDIFVNLNQVRTATEFHTLTSKFNCSFFDSNKWIEKICSMGLSFLIADEILFILTRFSPFSTGITFKWWEVCFQKSF